MEVTMLDPGVISKRETAYGSGEMEMEIPFQISAKSMDSQINARDEAALFSEFYDNGCGDKRNFVHEVAINPDDIPQFSR